MRPTPRSLLASATTTARGLRQEPMALLPPIPLYRRLLRAHRRHLPQQMRLLGDEYVKAEFRAHKTVDNPAHLVCFGFCCFAWFIPPLARVEEAERFGGEGGLCLVARGTESWGNSHLSLCRFVPVLMTSG